MSKISKLEASIKEAQIAYYNGSEIISDDEYDALIYELIQLNPNHPLIIQIGAQIINEWKKEKHLYPLGSLNKVNSPEDMEEWIVSVAKNEEVFVTEKLDGLSIGCQYEDGGLIHAILRGAGGLEGEDILTNVLKMHGCVKNIPNFTGVLRGEIILTKSNHQAHFATYANPRNAASGLCRRFDGEGSQHLTVLFYQVLGQDFLSEQEQFDFLQKAKAITPNYKLCKSAKEVSQMWQEYQDKTRASLDYEIDGLVAAVNDVRVQEALGETNMRPKGKIAFKFANQFVKTTVKEIDFQVGNTGRITPVCWFEPVDILGSKVKKASVYNIAYITKLGLDVGAEILITKAGEIIPRVEKVVKSTGTIVAIPITCPTCDTNLLIEGEYLNCPNTEGCISQIEGRIKNWIKELNILELGDTLIEKLVKAELVKTPADLYTLTVQDLSELDRMGEKSAKNVYNSIWGRNPVPLDVFLGALSIPLIGSSSIRLLMEDGYDTLDAVRALTQEETEAIKGMGPARAASLVQGLIDNDDIINQLLDNGVEIKAIIVGKLTNKSFCFTGTMVNKRAELEQMVKEAGGTIKNVGKGLDYLVLSDETTTKAIKAKALGTKLLSEEDFLEMLE